MSSTLIKNGTVITFGENNKIIKNGAVLVQDNIIKKIGKLDEFIDIPEDTEIVDANNITVTGATVSGYWTGEAIDSDDGITDASGIVILKSDRVKRASGTFTFTVDDVSLSGWLYDPPANVETSDSITV